MWCSVSGNMVAARLTDDGLECVRQFRLLQLESHRSTKVGACHSNNVLLQAYYPI